MGRILISSVLALCLAVPVIAGEEVEKKVSLWEMIRTKIEKVTPQKKPSVTTAVGGVRGSKAETGKELYWKGEDSQPVVEELELDSFMAALVEAESGNYAHSRVLFEKFVTDFPASSLKDDALFALHELGEDAVQAPLAPQTVQTVEEPETVETAAD